MRRTVSVCGWNLVAALLLGACGDDSVAATDGGSGSGSTGVTTEDIPTTDPPPTVTPDTDAPTTTPVTVTETTDVPTTTVTDTDTSTTGTDTDPGTSTTGTDTDTGTTTDTTGGSEVVGKSVSQTVNGGTVASSDNFRMVFTLGQPTANQGTYKSANFRLQGGLVGANGSPP